MTLRVGQLEPQVVGKSQEGSIIVLSEALRTEADEIVNVDLRVIFSTFTVSETSTGSAGIKGALMGWNLRPVHPRN